MDEGQFNHDIEVIAGSNKDEGILYFIAQLLDPTQWEYSRTTFNTTGPKLLFNIADESEITDNDIENAHKLLNYYAGSVDNINEEHKEAMFKMTRATRDIPFSKYGSIHSELVRKGIY